MANKEEKIVDLSVNLLKANQTEEETRAQHTCEKRVQERKLRRHQSLEEWHEDRGIMKRSVRICKTG